MIDFCVIDTRVFHYDWIVSLVTRVPIIMIGFFLFFYTKHFSQ